MSGIVGIVTRQGGPESVATLKRMARRLTQDPEDRTGTLCIPERGFFLAWSTPRVLSNLDLPVATDSGSIVIYGELYQDEVVNSDWIRRNCSAGIDVLLRELNGWFSGVLVDETEKRLVIFNDRYGIGRLYYHVNTTGFYFASEAKALLAVLPETRQIRARSLGQFFSAGCVLEDQTLFEGISVIPSGSAWEVRPELLEKRAYFSCSEWESLPACSEGEFTELVSDTFNRILPRYLKSANAMGMSLTGGVDSRLVLAGSRLPPRSLPCYTFGGPYRQSSDVKLARTLARTCGQDHTVIQIGDEFIKNFPSLAERTVFISDGTLDVTGAVELYVNEQARRIAPVRLTGNYGGEIMRNLVAFRPDASGLELLDGAVRQEAAATTDVYNRLRRGNALSFIAFRQVPWHHYGRLKLEQSQIVLRTPFLDNDFVRAFYRRPQSFIAGKELSLGIIETVRPELGKLATDRSAGGYAGALSAKVRKFVQNFTFKMEYAYDYGMPDWAAPWDARIKKLQPERLFLGYHRFYHFRPWYRDKLGSYLRDCLLDSRSLNRSYLDKREVLRCVNDHLDGRRNMTVELTKLLTLELIQRKLCEEA